MAFPENIDTQLLDPTPTELKKPKRRKSSDIQPPPENHQMRQRNQRINYLIDISREKKPMNVRELAALAEEAFPGISTPTRNAYARAANRILKLPYTADFPEI